jgi:hypothetical protein
MIKQRTRNIRAIALGVSVVVGLSLTSTAIASAATAADAPAPAKALSVDLSTVTGPVTGVGQGILYGITQDGSQPADQYIKPLGINAFRGGGWFSGGWHADKYTFGTNTQAEITAIIDQAKRLKSLSPDPDKFQYQVLLSDLWGSTGGAGADFAAHTCSNGDCANWLQFIDSTVPLLEASGIHFTYDIINESDLSIFWAGGSVTPQWFDMWDTAYKELRKVAPTAEIAGPSFAYTPARSPQEWKSFFAHVKAANTVPDWITNHDEGDVDDPVTVAQDIRADLTEAGLPQLPLSANEYQPADRGNAGTTAWYLDRFAQSTYSTAMRGNWSCCMVPNITGLLTHAPTGWAPTGNWWAMKTYADMSGSLVQTSQQVGSTAITAAKDPSKGQAIALLGDVNGYTGQANVTFTGLGSAAYLVRQKQVHATVYRMPDAGALYSPIVESSADLPVNADGSVTVPTQFVSSKDAIAVYLSVRTPQVAEVQAPHELLPGTSYDVPVVFTNGSASQDTQVQTSLSVAADNPADASSITVECLAGGGSTCPGVSHLKPGESTTATFRVTLPSTAPNVPYRLVASINLVNHGHVTVSNSADVISPCALGANCEAESGTLAGGACLATDHPGYTGSGFVACFTGAGPSVSQKFSVPAAGSYTLDLRYAAGPDGPSAKVDRTMTVTAGGVSQQVKLPATGSWNAWKDATTTVTLPQGDNDITVTYKTTDTGWINLDHLVLTK